MLRYLDNFPDDASLFLFALVAKQDDFLVVDCVAQALIRRQRNTKPSPEA